MNKFEEVTGHNVIRSTAIYIVKVTKKEIFSKHYTVLISTPEQILIHNSLTNLERKYTNKNEQYI